MIRVGKIVNTHGHKGALKVQYLTDYPERFEELKEVYLHENGAKEKLTISSVKYQQKNLILEFKEIEDMNQAELLKGKYLFINKEDVKPLPEGYYYIFDLLGLKVYEDDNYLGEILDVIETGSNDVYLVRDGKKEILIPALKKVVLQVDLENKIMKVKLLEGSLDEPSNKL